MSLLLREPVDGFEKRASPPPADDKILISDSFCLFVCLRLRKTGKINLKNHVYHRAPEQSYERQDGIPRGDRSLD